MSVRHSKRSKRERKRKKKKITKSYRLFLIYSPQPLPKTYLSAPVVFPLSSRSCGILGTSSAAIHRITESREILSRIMQEECCWFATQSRCGVSRISDGVVAGNLDAKRSICWYFSCQQPRNKECFCRGNTMTHPTEVLRRRGNYESFISERGDGGYVIISASADGNRNNNNNNSSSSTEDDEFGNEICKKTTSKKNPEKNDGSI
ncbi:uncharacterized protein LOC122531573 isoform X1 [Frieseomelitta varia]|uniref:uncharacterized protein LOC122531573 isoform X1 n=1 Tax=Frieseomelitta varia TaxID=561572 RepID=UPI001CB6A7F8|nr:uncharacterized protein LOC122531573 isoform X1 [Frieseomelitta varia]